MSESVPAPMQFPEVMQWMAKLPPTEHFVRLLCFSWHVSRVIMMTDSCEAEFDSEKDPGVSVRTVGRGLGGQAFAAFAFLDTALSLRCRKCNAVGHGEPHAMYGGVIAHPLATMAARILKQGTTIANEDYDAEYAPPDMVVKPELMLAVLRDPDCIPFLGLCEKPGIVELLRLLEEELVEAVASGDWSLE